MKLYEQTKHFTVQCAKLIGHHEQLNSHSVKI